MDFIEYFASTQWWSDSNLCSKTLTDTEAQCYLDRYGDLQKAYGKSGRAALDSAKRHWKIHGCKEKEKRIYTCNKTCDVKLNDVQAQCYLNNYSDLRTKYGSSGPDAIKKAKDDWRINGCENGRNYNCKSYTMSPSQFKFDIYKNAYCTNDPNGFTSFFKQKLISPNDVLLSIPNTSSEQVCKDNCKKYSECTYYNYNTANKNCFIYRDFPSSTKDDFYARAGLKNTVGVNYSQLSTADQKLVKDNCIKLKLDATTKDCYTDVRKDSRNNYIDFDNQCVWSKKGGQVVNTSTYNNPTNLDINSKDSPIISSYQTNFNKMTENRNNFDTEDRSLNQYDVGFNDWNSLRKNQYTSLKDNYIQTVKENADYQTLISEIVNMYIGSDKEGFGNSGYSYRREICLFIFVIFVFIIFLYMNKKK